jgi:hypothetical protein
MPKTLTVVYLDEILHHAVSLGYEQYYVCKMEEFSDLYPSDGASLTYMNNTDWSEEKTWLEDQSNPEFKQIMETFMQAFDLMTCEWYLARS